MIAADVPAPANAKSLKPYDYVGICHFDSEPNGRTVVWHPSIRGDSPAPLNIFHYLERSDIDRCLSSLVEQDKRASADIKAFAKHPINGLAAAVNDVARQLWSKFGVDRAILEVAESGHRGIEAEALLARNVGIDLKTSPPTPGTGGAK